MIKDRSLSTGRGRYKLVGGASQIFPLQKKREGGGRKLTMLKEGGTEGFGVVLTRDFPDHATFREKGAKLAYADKLGVFLSLTLCNEANFDPLESQI